MSIERTVCMSAASAEKRVRREESRLAELRRKKDGERAKPKVLYSLSSVRQFNKVCKTTWSSSVASVATTHATLAASRMAAK